MGRGADKAVKNFAAAMSARGHDVRLVERRELVAALAEPWDAVVATGSNEAVDLDREGYFECRNRARVVLQLHLAPGGFFKWRHPLRNLAIKRAFRKADAAQLLCSDYVAEFNRIAPGVKTRVIGNYTEMSADSQLLPHNSQLTTILYPAAVLSKVKNQKLLIEAFARIARRFPEWKVRMLGKADARYADECRALASRLGVADRVEFAGFTCDLAGEYAHAAFVAFPSTLEGFPLAVLEAAKFALPVVAQSTLPGVRDIVHDGETGFVTGPSPASYAEGLSRMIADPGLRRSLGEGARSRCDGEYSKERVLAAWEELLEETKKAKQ